MSIDVMDDMTASPEAVSAPGTAVDAMQAFDELRLEVLKTQQMLEQLRPVLTRPAPPDYTPSLARIAQSVDQLGSHLQGIEAHPALTLTPAAYQ
jgi:hypothetical protein